MQEIRPYFKGRLVLLVAPPVAGEDLVVSAGRTPTFNGWTTKPLVDWLRKQGQIL
ncbi:MAG: hypothetical protein ACRYFX_11585 [Janthinobacterium lividum]